MKSLDISKNTMSSLEIAELSRMTHDNVLKAIRKMEASWVKACQSFYKNNDDVCSVKFNVTSRDVNQPNGGTRQELMYDLTKSQSLFVATKFNDEARALLILRWEQLERLNVAIHNNMGLEIHNGELVTTSTAIARITGVPHDEVGRFIKRILDKSTEVINGVRFPMFGNLRKGKMLVHNIREISVMNGKGVPQTEYTLTDVGLEFLLKGNGQNRFSDFLPHYSRAIGRFRYDNHLKLLESNKKYITE